MAFETGLENKPWYFSAGAGAAVALVIVALMYWLQLDGMYDSIQQVGINIEANRAELDRLQKKIDEGQAAKRSLPQFREEVNRLQLELEKLLRVLPTRRNTEDLLRRIRTLTEQGDFKLLRFTPRDRQQKDFYYEWPIQLALEGNFHDLALFFDRVSRFSRIVTIENLNVSAKPFEDARSIGATFTMKTYLYIETKPEEGGGT